MANQTDKSGDTTVEGDTEEPISVDAPEVDIETVIAGARLRESVGAAKLTQAQAAKRLREAGITWSSSGNCSNRNNPRCTSFEQINATTVDGIITFKHASGCAVNITGGTETGHADGTYSHSNGFKVDITPNTCVSRYIQRTFHFIGKRKGDGAPMYRSDAGNVYARESNHWDILYLTG